MRSFLRLMAAEALKLRHSGALRLAMLLPLLYLVIEFFVFERPALSLRALTPELYRVLDTLQVKMAGTLWAGFFHPLMLALLPALLFRPEHRYRVWGHLHAMPVSRRAIFLAKALTAAWLSAGMLLVLALGHWAERLLASKLNPLLDFPFHGWELARVLGWLWLGSLPLLAFYVWASDRINSLAVSVVFGLIGLMLTISLSGAEVPQAWRRDLIPWVLPYFCAQQAIGRPEARQETHIAGAPLRWEEKPPPDEEIIILPSGRRARIWSPVPWAQVFPPPKPTPPWVLALFSAGAGLMLLGFGAADAGRDRF